MAAKGGVALKFLQWFIRGVQFGCAALIFGIYSYFLAALHNHKFGIATSIKAVEGISGMAVLYTLACLLFLCCVAGLKAISFISVFLDVCFVAAFIYVATANKGGASSCQGYLDTPFGKGEDADTVEGSRGFTALPSFRTACKLQSACLAVSIIAIFFFIFSIIVEIALFRHRRKEKRYGPGPQNDYTSGSGSPHGGFFSRFLRRRKGAGAITDNSNTLPHHTNPDQLDHTRPSYATETTAVNHDHSHGYNNNNNINNNDHIAYNKYDTGYDHQSGVTGHGIPLGDPYGTPHGAGGGYPGSQDVNTYQPPPQNYRYEDGVFDRT